MRARRLPRSTGGSSNRLIALSQIGTGLVLARSEMRSEPPLHSPLPPPVGARGGAGGQRVAGDAVEAPEASVRSTLSTPAGPSRGLGGHGSCRYSPTVSRLPAATWLPNPSCRGVALGIKRELDGAGSESGPDPRDQQAHLAATAPPVRCPGHSSATSTRPSTLRRQAAPRDR